MFLVISLMLMSLGALSEAKISFGDLHPVYQIVFPKARAYVVCHGELGKVKWMKDGVELESQKEEYTTTEFDYLILPSVSREQEGIYECLGFGMHPFVAVAEIYTAELELVSRIEPPYIFADIGESVVFICNYNNDVAWFHMTTPDLPNWHPIRHENVLDFIVTRHNGGFYFCTGFNNGTQRKMSRMFLETEESTISDGSSKMIASANQDIQQERVNINTPTSRTVLSEDHFGDILQQLMPIKHDWESIAKALRFRQHEIEGIRHTPTRAINGRYIFDVISAWLQWVPGDARGSRDLATLEALQEALNSTGHDYIRLSLTRQ